MGNSMTHWVSAMSSTIDGNDDDLPNLAVREWSDSDSSEDQDYPLVKRHVKRVAKQNQKPSYNSNISTNKSSKHKCYHGTTSAELDSHADTCSFGKQAFVVADTGQTISVLGFLSSLGIVKNVPVVTAAIAYNDPVTYQTYILFFHQPLYFGKMDKHLICPSQLCSNQNTGNDVPLPHLPVEERNHMLHSIVTQPPPPELHIPLFLNGTTSYFETRKPTTDEVASKMNCIHVHMTSDQYWDPYNRTVDAHKAAVHASLDQMPHERGQVLTPIAMISLLAAVQKEWSKADELFSKSKTMVHASRHQPKHPIVV